jgi:hypothetical protein
MHERDNDSKASLREFAHFGTEIHLERVNSPSEHELCGSLELYSSDPEGLAAFLSKKKGLTAQHRVVGGDTELMVFDPDGHIVIIVKTPDQI